MENTHRKRAREIITAAMLAAVLGAAAACTGSSSGSSSGSSNTGNASTAQAGAAPTATAGAPGGATTQGSSTSTGAATPATPSGSAAGAHAANVSACTGAQLKVTLGRAGAAAGHAGQPLEFTNKSSKTCTLQGYPGAAIMNGSKVVLNATRMLNGYIGDETQLSNVPLVTLAPGDTAAAMLEWEHDSGQGCVAGGTGTLQVTPPNTTVTIGLGSMTAGPDGVCSDFDIHPVVAGTLS